MNSRNTKDDVGEMKMVICRNKVGEVKEKVRFKLTLKGEL